jgi:predicted O-methyltransferase YrrM
MVVGVGVERFAPGYGALAGTITAIALIVFLLHRWKEVLHASSLGAYYKAHEAEAMALLAANDGFPSLPWSTWALSADALQRFIGLLRVRDCRTVVECGSGISTIVMAREFRSRGKGHVWAVEEDEHWADLVREMLVERGLSEWATIVVAPLEPLEIDELHFQWYSAAALKDVLALKKIDALLVDGPKGDTCRLARYPAFPMFRNQLGATFITVLDDARRPDETRIAALWRERYGVEFDYCNTRWGQWEAVR